MDDGPGDVGGRRPGPRRGRTRPDGADAVGEIDGLPRQAAATRGLALAHLDATLLGRDDAARFLAGDVEGVLAARGVDAFAYPQVSSARAAATGPSGHPA